MNATILGLMYHCSKWNYLCTVFLPVCLSVNWLFEIPDIWIAANYLLSEDKGSRPREKEGQETNSKFTPQLIWSTGSPELSKNWNSERNMQYDLRSCDWPDLDCKSYGDSQKNTFLHNTEEEAV